MFGETYTDKLREKFRDHGFIGKRVTFRFRQENGKSKKVSGKLIYVSHKPNRGFRLHLIKVRWLGRYWAGAELVFPTHRIIWVRHEIPKLLEATL